MDPTQLLLMQQMLGKMYSDQQDENERPSTVVIACYGCEHLCASPLSCGHPATVVVRWDKFNDRSYRMPSIEGCIRKNGECNFYTPDEHTGLGYAQSAKGQQKARVTKIDSVLNKLDDDDCDIEDFLEDLKNLDDELNREDGITDDKKDKGDS